MEALISIYKYEVVLGSLMLIDDLGNFNERKRDVELVIEVGIPNHAYISDCHHTKVALITKIDNHYQRPDASEDMFLNIFRV